MSASFEKNAPSAAESMTAALKYHPALVAAQVNILPIISRKFNSDGDEEPSIMMSRCPCAGQAKVYSLKQRTLTGYDAEIMVDGMRWDDLSEAQRVALMDHELNHFAPKIGAKDGKLQYDTLGRPKLDTIPDDVLFTCFYGIVERHGKNALEAIMWERISLSINAALRAAATAFEATLKKKQAA